jgi:hypothetical protein
MTKSRTPAFARFMAKIDEHGTPRPVDAVLDLFKRLQEMNARLAGVDAGFGPIRDRVARSRLQIRHIQDELAESRGQEFNAVRLEVINLLWWEIQAIPFLRKRLGRKPGATGKTQKLVRELLTENPNATTTDAVVRLNLKQPGHGLKRRSITVAKSKAKKALGIKKS